jgi:hypothetical protein
VNDLLCGSSFEDNSSTSKPFNSTNIRPALLGPIPGTFLTPFISFLFITFEN